jgi:hypothetical protein
LCAKSSTDLDAARAAHHLEPPAHAAESSRAAPPCPRAARPPHGTRRSPRPRCARCAHPAPAGGNSTPATRNRLPAGSSVTSSARTPGPSPSPNTSARALPRSLVRSAARLSSSATTNASRHCSRKRANMRATSSGSL